MPRVLLSRVAGVGYTLLAQATTSAGTGAYSADAQSLTATPGAVPGAASWTSLPLAADGKATVGFSLAASLSGGRDVTHYIVTSTPGGLTATRTLSPVTVTGLTNGQARPVPSRASDRSR